jgi:hypothetical protein
LRPGTVRYRAAVDGVNAGGVNAGGVDAGGTAEERHLGLLAAATILFFGMAVQLALETSAELTAETLADNDIGIVATLPTIANTDIIDISPAAMLVVRPK